MTWVVPICAEWTSAHDNLNYSKLDYHANPLLAPGEVLIAGRLVDGLMFAAGAVAG